MFTDVRIGLMSSNITAYESNRDVNVTLQINGEAQREVFVFLVKEDGTATGQPHSNCDVEFFLYTQFVYLFKCSKSSFYTYLQYCVRHNLRGGVLQYIIMYNLTCIHKVESKPFAS